MTLSERCAYLKGLAEGMKLDTEKNENKLIAELIALCSEMAEEIEDIDEDLEELEDYVEELDEDLGEVEEYVYDLEDDCDCDFDDYEDDEDDDFECDGDCFGCSVCEGEDDDEYCENMRCALCSNCGDTICFEEDMDPSNIVCPSCGTKLMEDTEDEE